MEAVGNRATASLLHPVPEGSKDAPGTEDKPAAEPPVVRPTLRRGSNGDDVSFVQAVLVSRGWPVAVDGQFDAETAAYVCLLQQRWHIDIDGTVGRDTWAALDAELEPGGEPLNGSGVADAAAAISGGPGPATEYAASAAAVAARQDQPAVQRQEAGDGGGETGGKEPASSVDAVGPGSISPDVMLIQLGLKMAFPGAAIALDGIYGDATRAYVLLYQHDHGLAIDGIVGPQTRVHLDPTLSAQRHVAASEELLSILEDLEKMTDDQRAAALPQIGPRIIAATKTLGEQDF